MAGNPTVKRSNLDQIDNSTRFLRGCKLYREDGEVINLGL